MDTLRWLKVAIWQVRYNNACHYLLLISIDNEPFKVSYGAQQRVYTPPPNESD